MTRAFVFGLLHVFDDFGQHRLQQRRVVQVCFDEMKGVGQIEAVADPIVNRIADFAAFADDNGIILDDRHFLHFPDGDK